MFFLLQISLLSLFCIFNVLYISFVGSFFSSLFIWCSVCSLDLYKHVFISLGKLSSMILLMILSMPLTLVLLPLYAYNLKLCAFHGFPKFLCIPLLCFNFFFSYSFLVWSNYFFFKTKCSIFYLIHSMYEAFPLSFIIELLISSIPFSFQLKAFPWCFCLFI